MMHVFDAPCTLLPLQLWPRPLCVMEATVQNAWQQPPPLCSLTAATCSRIGLSYLVKFSFTLLDVPKISVVMLFGEVTFMLQTCSQTFQCKLQESFPCVKTHRQDVSPIQKSIVKYLCKRSGRYLRQHHAQIALENTTQILAKLKLVRSVNAPTIRQPRQKELTPALHDNIR